MKTLIIYASKYGATKKSAECIANLIADATLCNIGIDNVPALLDYDCIVIGSPVAAGNINGKIKKFMATNAEELKIKKLGLYLSGFNPSGAEDYITVKNYPQVIVDAAKARAVFGGIYDPDNSSFVVKKLLHAITKFDSYTDTIDEEKISEFVKQLL